MNTNNVRNLIILLLLCNPLISTASAKKDCKNRITTNQLIATGFVSVVSGFTLLSLFTASDVEDIPFTDFQLRRFAKQPAELSTSREHQVANANTMPQFKHRGEAQWYQRGLSSCIKQQKAYYFPLRNTHKEAFSKGRDACLIKQKYNSNNPLQQKTKR